MIVTSSDGSEKGEFTCKEREYWEKTEGFFITDCFMRFFISHRELVSPRTQHIRGSDMFRSIYKSKEALSSSPET